MNGRLRKPPPGGTKTPPKPRITCNFGSTVEIRQSFPNTVAWHFGDGRIATISKSLVISQRTAADERLFRLANPVQKPAAVKLPRKVHEHVRCADPPQAL